MNFNALLANELWEAVWLTCRLAFITTAALLLIGTPLAYWLSASRWRGIVLIEAIVSLPIVLPPTVIGFYLLIILSPQHPLGQFWLNMFGYSLTFSFTGLVIGSVIYSLPFATQPFQAAFKSVPRELIEAGTALGAKKWPLFWKIQLRVASPGIMVGCMLSFAHTLGEFGVVLMLGGSIPGETRVASIALFDKVQALDYSAAHAYSLVLLSIALVLLIGIGVIRKKLEN